MVCSQIKREQQVGSPESVLGPSQDAHLGFQPTYKCAIEPKLGGDDSDMDVSSNVILRSRNSCPKINKLSFSNNKWKVLYLGKWNQVHQWKAGNNCLGSTAEKLGPAWLPKLFWILWITCFLYDTNDKHTISSDICFLWNEFNSIFQ